LHSSYSTSVKLAIERLEEGSLTAVRCYSLRFYIVNLTEEILSSSLAGYCGAVCYKQLVLLAVLVDLW